MSKTENISTFVFDVLGQFCWYTANGYKVEWSPFPNVSEDGNPENRITFKVVGGDYEVPFAVKEALNMVNTVFAALNSDKDIFIDKLSVEGDEEAKYTVTIKKTSTEVAEALEQQKR